MFYPILFVFCLQLKVHTREWKATFEQIEKSNVWSHWLRQMIYF